MGKSESPEQKPADVAEQARDLAERWERGDPEAGGELLDLVIKTREAAERAGINVNEIRPDTVIEKAGGLIRRWKNGDPKAGAELLDLVIQTREAEQRSPAQAPEPAPATPSTGLWDRVKKFFS